MSKKYKDDFISNKQYYDYSNQKDDDEEFILTEEDFYPLSDDRTFQSYVEDIDGGDNFAEYTEYFFEMYEDDLFDS